MREILFRGKRADNGNWIEGHLFVRINDCFIIPLPIITSKSLVDRETIGQYTGLTDKNGNKIFEGDIHECVVEEESHLFVVKHGKYYDSEISDKKYGWYFENAKAKDCTGFYGDEEDYVTIIGNIHDNPELLENP